MARIRVDGFDVHYEASGAGPPCVCLIHGTGGSGGVWMRQLEGLADVARIVAPDLPGHGQTGGEPLARIADLAAFVGRFLDALGVSRAVMGGHSMGGAVAQQFALTWPDRTEGLVLVGTGARLRVLPRLLQLLAGDYPEGVKLLMQLAVAAEAPAGLKATLHRETAANPQRVVLGDLQACNVFDVMDRIGTVRVPTLAICGQEDQLTPPRYSTFFAEHIPGARAVVVLGSGHYVQIEQAEATTGELSRFLAATPRSAI